jgi:hypothetical protein
MTKRYILQTPVLWYISARIEAGLTDGTYIFKPKCFMAIWNLFRPFGTFYVWTFGIFCGNLVYFVAIWYILWQFGIFCGNLVYFVAIWYIFSHFGMLYQEKSGNPAHNPSTDNTDAHFSFLLKDI